MGQLLTVDDVSFQETVLKSATPVLVDFWAPRCAPCRLLEPGLDEMAGEYRGRVAFVKIDRDANPAAGNRFGVMGLPTVMLFKQGRPVSSLTGFNGDTRRQLHEQIESVL